jgi:glycosyltransferase involved in cell wall biosynthesis
VPDAQQLTHIGTMYWPPNIDGMLWFIREIYPLVRAEKPGSGLEVIGARPPQELVALQQEVPGLQVHGYVAKLDPYLARCGVFIVPLRAGGGMRVKILEALSRGLPVVTTTLGCEGIMVTDGQHVLIADTPRDFAQAVLRVLNDPALSTALVKNGRRQVETIYDYRAACRALEQAYGVPSVQL